MRTLLTARLANNIESTVLLADGLKDLSTHLGSYGRSVLWIFDTNTAKLFKQLPPSHVVLESGESQKNFASLERIISTALEEGLARDGRIIGFGGGVVCDLAGFAASVYMRGCTLTLVPTTLLAMVDASLGGKTAIDYRGVKNIVGSFYPAREVLISTDVLHTLNEREYLNGLGEVLKHALLSSDDRLYHFVVTYKNEILSRDAKILDLMVELSLRVKLEYIEQDPTEQLGIRQMLNLGHTFGLFRSYGYDVDYRIGRGDWISYREHLMKDKKRLDGKLLFVLLEGQGSGVLKTLDTALIQQLVIAKPTF